MQVSRNIWDKERGVWQPRLLEEHILREIVERLWLQARIKVFRIREPIPVKGKRWNRYATPGIPDLVGWIPDNPVGRPVGIAVPLFIEVKRPGGVRREAQKRFIEEARTGGCIAFFAESWNDCVMELGKFGVSVNAA